MGKIELKSRAKYIEKEKREFINKIFEKPIEEITPQDFYFLNEDDILKLLKKVAEKFKGWDWNISNLKSIPKLTIYFEGSYCIIEVWDDFFLYSINKKGEWKDYNDNFTKIGDLLKYFKDKGLLKENKLNLKSRAKENEEESIKFYSDKILSGEIRNIPTGIIPKLTDEIKFKYIETLMEQGYRLTSYVFKFASDELKLKHIEKEINDFYYLPDDKFYLLSDELKLKYIEMLIEQGWNLQNHEQIWYEEYKRKNITENKINLKSRVDIIKKEREEKIDDILKKPLEEINGDDLRLLTLNLQNIPSVELGMGNADFSLILKFYDKVKTYFNNLGIEVIDKSYSKYPGLLFVGNENSDETMTWLINGKMLIKYKETNHDFFNMKNFIKTMIASYKPDKNIKENRLKLRSRAKEQEEEKKEIINNILKKPLENITFGYIGVSEEFCKIFINKINKKYNNIFKIIKGGFSEDFLRYEKDNNLIDINIAYFPYIVIYSLTKKRIIFSLDFQTNQTLGDMFIVIDKIIKQYNLNELKEELVHENLNLKSHTKKQEKEKNDIINNIIKGRELKDLSQDEIKTNIKENKINLKSRAKEIEIEKEEYVKELYDKIKPLKGVNWDDIINFIEIDGEEKIINLIVDYFKPYIKYDIFLYFRILNSSNYLFKIMIYKQSIELIRDEEIVKDIFFNNTDEMLEIIQNLIDTYSIKKQTKLRDDLKENKLNLKSRAKEQFKEKVKLINSTPITSQNYNLVLDDEYNPQKELIDLVSDEKKKEIIDISETIKEQYKRIKLNEEKVKDILNKEGLLKDNLTMNPDINEDEWFGLNKIFFGYYYQFDIDVVAEYNIKTDKLSIDWDTIKFLTGDYRKRIDEQNSELEGKEFTIPPFVKEEIKNKQKEYGMTTKRSNYLINQNTISYYEIKRLKNFFDNNYDGVDFYLAGGNEMKGWVNNILNQYRGQIHNKKKILYDIGLDNQFKKTHTKDNKKLVKPELGIKKLPLKSRNIFYNLSENKLNLKSRAKEQEKEKEEYIKNIINERELKDLSWEELRKLEDLNYDLTPFFIWLGEELKKTKPFLKYEVDDFFTKNDAFFNNKKYLKLDYFEIKIFISQWGFRLKKSDLYSVKKHDEIKDFQKISTLIKYFNYELLK